MLGDNSETSLSHSRIHTGADALLSLVGERKVLAVGKAARELGCEAEQVRLLAESLEDMGKIVIYQTISDILIVDREHYVAMNGSVRGKTRTFLKSLFNFSPKRKARFDDEERGKALEELSSTLAQRSSMLEKRSEEADRREGELDTLRQQLDDYRHELDTRERSLVERERGVSDSERQVDRKLDQLRTREAKVTMLLERARSFFD